MADVTIHLLTEDDAEDMLCFELENRALFAETLSDRGDDYFNLDHIREALRESAREEEERDSYLYLVRDRFGEAVGRINLYGIEYGNIQRAEVG